MAISFEELLKNVSLQNPTVNAPIHNVYQNLDRIQKIPDPGVYIIYGLRNELEDGNTIEPLYVGKTRSRTRNIGDRIVEQLNTTSTLKKNIASSKYHLCQNKNEYEEYIQNAKGKCVYIDYIIAFTFDTTDIGLRSRDLLEPVMINSFNATPYFNREFVNVSVEERDDVDFDINYKNDNPIMVAPDDFK